MNKQTLALEHIAEHLETLQSYKASEIYVDMELDYCRNIAKLYWYTLSNDELYNIYVWLITLANWKYKREIKQILKKKKAFGIVAAINKLFGWSV